MAGTTQLRVASLGAEVTWGTPVARTLKLMEVTGPPSITPEGSRSRGRQQGSFAPAGATSVNKAGATGMIPFRVTYEDLPIYLQNPLGVVTPGATPYPRVYTLPDASRPTPHPYTLEMGDPGNIYILSGAIMNALTLGAGFDDNDGDWMGSASFIGTSKSAIAAGNEVQTITITGTPTGGTFKMSFMGQETASINFDALNSAVDSALEALAAIGAGNVAVTGTNPNFTATFGGALAGIDVPLLVLSTNALTGGTTPSVTIATTTGGGGATALANRAVEKMGIGSTTIAVDALGGTMGATAVTAALISFSHKATFGYHSKHFAGSKFAQGFGWGPMDVELATVFEYTAVVKAWVDSMLTGTAVEKLIRIGNTGTASKVVNIDGAYSLDFPPDVGDRDGNTTISLTWNGLNPAALGYWSRYSVSNAVAALAA